MIAVTTWTCKLAAWLSTPGTRLSENHVCLDVPTKWSRSVPRKVAPQVTMTGGWPTAGDRHGRVRVDLSLRACSVGGSGGPDRPGTAWGSLELRVERGSNVAMRPSACGCMRMVAELLLGHQTPCMLPRSTPGVPFHSAGLVSPPWVAQLVHCGVWVRGPPTAGRRGGEGGGGPTSGGVPAGIIKSFFRAVFCVIPSSIGTAPTLKHSQPPVIG